MVVIMDSTARVGRAEYTERQRSERDLRRIERGWPLLRALAPRYEYTYRIDRACKARQSTLQWTLAQVRQLRAIPRGTWPWGAELAARWACALEPVAARHPGLRERVSQLRWLASWAHTLPDGEADRRIAMLTHRGEVTGV